MQNKSIPQVTSKPSSAGWITIVQTAAIAGVHPDTIRRMIARGELKAYRFGRGIRIRRQDLDKAITSRPVTSLATVVEMDAA